MEAAHPTSARAEEALQTAIGKLDAVGLTLAAIARAEHEHAQEMVELRESLRPALCYTPRTKHEAEPLPSPSAPAGGG